MLHQPVPRASYLELIDRDRARRRETAADERQRGASLPSPPRARPGYPRKRALDRALARRYERCKQQNAGRFKTDRRLKGYCAAVAWTVTKRTGQFSDYQGRKPTKESTIMAMPKRDAKGRFIKRGREASRRASAPRRAAAPKRASEGRSNRAPHAVKAYTYKRGGKTVHVPAHRSREAKQATSSRRPSSSHRPAPRRAPPQTNIAIVPVGTMARAPMPRRRSYAREMSGMSNAAGVTLLMTGAVTGNLVADVVDRLLAGINPSATTDVKTLPNAYQTDNAIFTYNNDAVAMPPGLWRVLAQLGLTVFGLGIGWIAKAPALKFLSYGFGVGAGTHLTVQLVNAYILVPMLTPAAGTAATGPAAAMYQHEITVNQALQSKTAGQGYMGNVTRGLPQGTAASPGGRMGAPPQLPANQPAARVPIALTSLMGQPQAAAAGCKPGCACAKCAPAAPQHQHAAPAPVIREQQPSNLGQPPSGGASYEGMAHPMWASLLGMQKAA